MKIVGMNNGSRITIIMRPELFIDVIDKLIRCYDDYIIAGVTEFLNISKFTTMENYATFRRSVLANPTKPIFFTFDLTTYLDNQRNESAAFYTYVISSITDSLVYNKDTDYSSSDFEIITPSSRSGSSFYIDDLFLNLRKLDSVIVLDKQEKEEVVTDE